MAERILDQGTVWWPAGLAPQETVQVVFNVALQERPSRMVCEDYETRQPVDIEMLAIQQSGTREWARYTGVSLRFAQDAQRGRSFRWRVFGKE